MFTGIIRGTAKVCSTDTSKNVLELYSEHFKKNRIILGKSIAVDGVCLTISEYDNSSQKIRFNLGQETISYTLLGQKNPKEKVHIEFALTLKDTLDGHLVQGHIDGLAKLKKKKVLGDNLILTFDFPHKLAPLIIKKGSIALNGVSLTINEVGKNYFTVCIVPYTLKNTLLAALETGEKVHIETDVLGRYFLRSNHLMKEIQHGQ